MINFSHRIDLDDFFQQKLHQIAVDVVEQIVEEKTEDYRRMVAKKVWKAFNSLTINLIRTMSPMDIKTHLRLVIQSKENPNE